MVNHLKVGCMGPLNLNGGLNMQEVVMCLLPLRHQCHLLTWHEGRQRTYAMFTIRILLMLSWNRKFK